MSEGFDEVHRLVLYVPCTEWGEHAGVAPTHIVRLAHYIRCTNKVDVRIIDAQVQFGIPLTAAGVELHTSLAVGNILSNCDDRTVLGISATSAQDIVSVLPIIQRVKREASIPIVIGGSGGGLAYRTLLAKYSGLIDAVVVGPGEYALSALLRSWKCGQFEPERIPGVAIRLADGIALEPPTFAVPRVGAPDWDLLPARDRYRCVATTASVGCPYRCAFCCESLLRRGVRQIDEAEYDTVLESIRHAFPGVQSIWLTDPLAGGTLKHAIRIVQAARRAQFSIFMNCRGDVFSEELAGALARSDSAVYFGLESANPDTLLQMRKTVDAAGYLSRTQDAFTWCKVTGLLPIVGTIANYPLMPYRTTRDTVGYLCRLAAEAPAQSLIGHVFSTSLFMLHAGDELYESRGALERAGCLFKSCFDVQYHGVEIFDGLEMMATATAHDYDLAAALAVQEQIKRYSVIGEREKRVFRAFGYFDHCACSRVADSDVIDIDSATKH